MATSGSTSNKYAALSTDVSDEVGAFNLSVDDIVDGALHLLPPRQGKKDRELVGDIVKAVVAAFLPLLQGINSQLKHNPGQISPKVKEAMQRHDDKLVDMEQEQRRDNIIVRGVPESPDESTGKLVVEVAAEAGVGFHEGDLSTSFRIGRQQQGKPRPILARFVRHNDRVRLLRSKKNLKNT